MPTRPSAAVAVLILIGLFVTTVYRAATQAITYDEAVTYFSFVRESVTDAFTGFNANNHVLFSALASISTHLLGTSELTLRLPAVVAGAGYLAVVFAIARVAAGGAESLFILTVAALSLNPLVLDFLSAARGYGLALFLFMVALFEILRETSDAAASARGWTVASIALGLSISANLAFLFPVLGLLLGASALTLASGSQVHAPKRALLRMWVPGALVAGAVLAMPLSRAQREHFVFGARGFGETVSSIVAMSLRHHPTWWTATRVAAWIERGLVLLIPILLTLAIISAGLAVARGRAAASDPMRALTIVSGAWVATIALILGAHCLYQLPYPAERTGLYFIPLFVVTLVLAARAFSHPAATALAAAVLTLLTLTSLEQLTVSSYATWRFDAGSRAIAELMAAHSTGRPVTVATTEWLYQPALEYYRVVRFPTRLAPINDGFDRSRIDEFDFLVVDDEGAAVIDRSWRHLFTHPVSGAQVWMNPRSRL